MVYIRKILLLLLFLHYTANAFSSKAIWVVRDALTTKQNISEIINSAKELNCDKIFLQLRALGTVYYPSQLDIPKKEVDGSLLQNLFHEAQKNKIEIHIWLNICYVWPNKDKPPERNHILNKTSTSVIEPVDSSLKREGYFLHPNDKTNLSEVKSIMDELLKLYPIAGFHLDYFRYPKELFHTSKVGRTKFLINFGLDPIEPLKNPKKFIQNRGLASYIYFQEKYRDFLRNELTFALTDIHNFLKSKKENIQLSIAVKPNPIIAKHQFLQDWVSWLKKGLCDFVVIMNYSPDNKIFINNIKIIADKVDTSKIMVGVATYNIGLQDISERINFIKNTTYNGYALFSYNYIIQKSALFNLLKNI